jgi:hypothetical protein
MAAGNVLDAGAVAKGQLAPGARAAHHDRARERDGDRAVHIAADPDDLQAAAEHRFEVGQARPSRASPAARVAGGRLVFRVLVGVSGSG